MCSTHAFLPTSILTTSTTCWQPHIKQQAAIMESRRVLLIMALVALVASASAATCKQYSGMQAGARCNPPETCCGSGMWCDMGRCSLRGVSEDEKKRQCKVTESQPGSRCDINNGLCCAANLKCDVGRCSAGAGH